MTMDQLTKMGKPPSDLGPMLKRVASLQPDVSQLTFVRCEAKTRVARLLYQREGASQGAHAGVRRVHDSLGRWRLANRLGGPVEQPATRSSGDKRSADELLGDPRLALE